MSNYKDDMRDDEIRVIGAQSRKQKTEVFSYKLDPPGPQKPRKRKKAYLWALLLAILLIIGLILLLRSGKTKEDPYDGVFEPKEEIAVQPVKQEKKILGHEVDSLSSYTERIDTVINDVGIAIFIPHNATPELWVGSPPEKDPGIILAVQAADIRADNKEILGAFVYRGTPLAWGLSKSGYCAIIDGEMTIGTSENSPLFEQATETEGYFFRQFSLVNKGVLVENELKNKSVRKALCSRYGQIFVAVTASDESYHDFSQALVDLGVEDAISLVGSKYAFGWWIDRDGVNTSFAEGWHKYKKENYLIWKAR
ncbi:MAG: hypothetical protein J5939_07010 [Bacteroidales bacterium]|nr:hypothetical protein [Bacteroidales bacterium]